MPYAFVWIGMVLICIFFFEIFSFISLFLVLFILLLPLPLTWALWPVGQFICQHFNFLEKEMELFTYSFVCLFFLLVVGWSRPHYPAVFIRKSSSSMQLLLILLKVLPISTSVLQYIFIHSFEISISETTDNFNS